MGDLAADLDRIIDRDRRTHRAYLTLGAGIFLAGVAVMVAGFIVPTDVQGQAGDIQSLLVKLGGVLIGTFSAIPMKQFLERRERLAYVEVVREKCRALLAAPSPSQAELDKIGGIVWKLYESRAVG